MPIEGATETAAAVPAMTLQQHDLIVRRKQDGELTIEQYQAGFASLIASKDSLHAELSALKKDAILKRMGMMRAQRYKSEKKAACVEAAILEMITDYTLGDSISISMSGNIITSYERAMAAHVARATPEKFAEYATKIAQLRAERVQRINATRNAIENPQTLEDFETFIRFRGEDALTDVQAEAYDKLQAQRSLERMQANQAKFFAERTTVQAVGQQVGAQVIATKHTKHGYDIFVVQLGERVAREVYDKLNAAAKKLGGYYSSYRGNGAIPGFTFREIIQAQAFAALASEGNAQQATEVARERRDAFLEDKSQTTIERLRAMADRLEESGTESLCRERKTNSSNRAAIAAAAERTANAEIALAKTMRNIAAALEAGEAPFLAGLRTRSQLELFGKYLRRAHSDYASQQAKALNADSPGYSENDYRRFEEEPVSENDVRFVKYPVFRAYRGDLASLGRELLEVEGAKQLGASLLKDADDISEEYVKFVRDNLVLVSLRLANGEPAPVFASREAAEAARRRSPGRQKMAVVSLGRANNHVVLSPKEAIEREGPEDKLISWSPTRHTRPSRRSVPSMRARLATSDPYIEVYEHGYHRSV